MVEKRCQFCACQFEGKEKRKFCSMSCSAKNRIPEQIERNKSRRKYPAIPGLSRQSVFWMHNPEARKKDLARDVKKREGVILHLGGECVRCGYKENIRALELDHKNNDGDKDRKLYGTKIARYYIKNLKEAEEKLQVLCSNCNKIKAIEDEEHSKSCRTKFIYKGSNGQANQGG